MYILTQKNKLINTDKVAKITKNGSKISASMTDGSSIILGSYGKESEAINMMNKFIISQGSTSKFIFPPSKTPVRVPDAKVSNVEELLSAFSNLPAGSLIEITKDIEVSSPINISENVSATIDFGDNALIVPEAVNNRSLYAINNYGDITIENLTVEARGIQNYGKMTINNCDITDRDTNGGAALWTYAGSETVINGGTFRATYVGSVTEDYGPGCINNSGVMTINSAHAISASKRCYAIISGGAGAELTINDAIVEGSHGGITDDGNLLIINGGTFSATEFYGLYVSTDHLLGNGESSVTINGGTFKGKKYSVYLGSDVYTPVDAVVRINGGTFKNPMVIQDNVTDDSLHGIQIYGGNFSDKPNDSYIAEGYECSAEKNASGYFVVTKVS